MAPIKILVTNFHPYGGGGHDTYISSLTSLQADGFDITVAAPGTSSLYMQLRGINSRILAADFPSKMKELPAVIKAIRHFRRIISTLRPDIVHCNAGADLSICLWAGLSHNRPVIVRTHHAIKGIGGDFYHRWIYKSRVSANLYVSKEAMLLSHSMGLYPLIAP